MMEPLSTCGQYWGKSVGMPLPTKALHARATHDSREMIK